jgi:hypothetical protein
MTDQPDDWLAAERERNGCAMVLGTRAASSIPKSKHHPTDRTRLRSKTAGPGHCVSSTARSGDRAPNKCSPRIQHRPTNAVLGRRRSG